MNLGLGPSQHRPIVAGCDERYVSGYVSCKGMPTLLLCWNDERTCVVPLASPNSDTFTHGADFYLVIAGVAVVAVRHFDRDRKDHEIGIDADLSSGFALLGRWLW